MIEEEKKMKAMKVGLRMKLIVAGSIVAVLLVGVGLIFAKGYQNATDKYEEMIQLLTEENKRLSDQMAVYVTASKEVDISVINTEIQEIGELATLEYLYTDAGKFEDAQKWFGKEVPLAFLTKSFILKWDGIIKAGVDISQVTAQINRTQKQIIVQIPEAKILSHEIDEKSVETLDEKAGLFNPIKVEDVNQFHLVSKDSMEQRAIENGILEKALENAKEIIGQLVNTEVVQEAEYEIVFQVME